MQEIKNPLKSQYLAKYYLWYLMETISPYRHKLKNKPEFPASAKTHCVEALTKLQLMITKKEGRRILFNVNVSDTMAIATLFYRLTTPNWKKQINKILDTSKRIGLLFFEEETNPEAIMNYSSVIFGDKTFNSIIKSIVLMSRDYEVALKADELKDTKTILHNIRNMINKTEDFEKLKKSISPYNYNKKWKEPIKESKIAWEDMLKVFEEKEKTLS